jgi:hypothetical protein
MTKRHLPVSSKQDIHIAMPLQSFQKVEKKGKSDKGNHPSQAQKKRQHKAQAQYADAGDIKYEEQKAVLAFVTKHPHRKRDGDSQTWIKRIAEAKIL